MSLHAVARYEEFSGDVRVGLAFCDQIHRKQWPYHPTESCYSPLRHSPVVGAVRIDSGTGSAEREQIN